jgi:hypothetical protein
MSKASVRFSIIAALLSAGSVAAADQDSELVSRVPVAGVSVASEAHSFGIVGTGLHKPAGIVGTGLHKPAGIVGTGLHKPAGIVGTGLHKPAGIVGTGRKPGG